VCIFAASLPERGSQKTYGTMMEVRTQKCPLSLFFPFLSLFIFHYSIFSKQIRREREKKERWKRKNKAWGQTNVQQSKNSQRTLCPLKTSARKVEVKCV
jgi:hypothetical protein